MLSTSPISEDAQFNDLQGGTMLAAIAGVLVVLWLLGFLAFHVTAGTIHILLVVALVLFVMHFFRGSGATV
jgi:hypothetical protein